MAAVFRFHTLPPCGTYSRCVRHNGCGVWQPPAFRSLVPCAKPDIRSFFAPFPCIADFCGDARFRTPRLWCGVACGVCFDTFAVIFHKQNLCFFKSLFFKGLKRRKIQGTYFKISALYFKIYGLYFLQQAMCVFPCREIAFATCTNVPKLNGNFARFSACMPAREYFCTENEDFEKTFMRLKKYFIIFVAL